VFLMARKYEMKRRAEQVEETRRRITEAAVELHGTVGPARTTISAVAARAGVDRLTVYRHFPDEVALFQACTSHWLAHNPFPDPSPWSSIEDPQTRLRCALGELYTWYRTSRPMMENFFRDGPSVPALAGRLREWDSYQKHGRTLLARGWPATGRRKKLLTAAIGHALDFHTWRSLDRQNLDDATAAELMTALATTQTGYGRA
jgi:AcrR family transcriptional regulator